MKIFLIRVASVNDEIWNGKKFRLPKRFEGETKHAGGITWVQN